MKHFLFTLLSIFGDFIAFLGGNGSTHSLKNNKLSLFFMQNIQQKICLFFLCIGIYICPLKAQINIDSVSTYTTCDGTLSVYFSVLPGVFSPACSFQVRDWNWNYFGGTTLPLGVNNGVIQVTGLSSGVGAIAVENNCNGIPSNDVYIASGFYGMDAIDIYDENGILTTAICNGGQINLYANPVLQNPTYSWSNFNNPMSYLTDNPTDTITYTLYIQEQGVACPPYIESVTVPVYPVLNANIAINDTSLCGDSLWLNANITGGSGSYGISWSDNWNPLSNSQDCWLVTNINSGPTHSVELYVYEMNGQSSTCAAPYDIATINLYNPTFEPTFSPSPLCGAGNVYLNFPFAWGGTDNYIFTANPPIIDFFSGQVYLDTTTTFILTMEDVSGLCPSVISDTVTVTVYPPFYTVLNDTTACEWSFVTLSPILIGGSSPYTYSWSNGSTQPTASYTAWASGISQASVQITDANGCLSSDYMQIATYPIPPIPVITAANGIVTCSVPNMASYQWFLNGQPLPNETSQQIDSALIGIYSVVVTNQYGCTASSDNVYVAVEEFQAFELNVSPNPTEKQIQIRWGDIEEKEVEISLYDTKNALLLHEMYPYIQPNSSQFLNVETYTEGIYILCIKSAKRQKMLKIVKY